MSTAARVLRIEDEVGAGQLALPVDLREKLGLRRGDLVSIVETPEGLLISSRQVTIERDLALAEAELQEHGLTLDELVESGREIRAELTRNQYGIDG